MTFLYGLIKQSFKKGQRSGPLQTSGRPRHGQSHRTSEDGRRALRTPSVRPEDGRGLAKERRKVASGCPVQALNPVCLLPGRKLQLPTAFSRPGPPLLVKAFRCPQARCPGPGGFVIVRTVSAKRPRELEKARKMPKPGNQR